MLNSQRISIKLSETRQRLNEIGGLEGDAFTAEIHQEADRLGKDYADLEVRYRSSLLGEGQPEVRTLAGGDNPEMRERMELRQRATLTGYLVAAASGRQVSGAEAELQQAAGVTGIPIELFDVPRAEERADMATTSPTTGTGVFVDPVRPMIYARSVITRLGIAMPRIETGTYSTMTISTGLSAAAITAGDPAMATAAVLTPQTTTPHRVSARLSLRIEDIAQIGVQNFEASLRSNLMLAMSDRLDFLGLTGDGTAPNPEGLLPQLTDPTDPSAVVDFDGFVAAMAGGIDGGPWGESMMDVSLLVNAETLRKAETTFQSTATYKGEVSAGSYLRANSAMFFSSKRMPDTASTIAQAIRYRRGTMGLDGVDAMRTAVCPMWANIGIDDIYTDSASGIRHFTVHNLIGSILIEQPNAYERVDLKLA